MGFGSETMLGFWFVVVMTVLCQFRNTLYTLLASELKKLRRSAIMKHLNLSIALNTHIACVAVLEVSIGVTILLSTVWTAAGIIVVALGLVTLWLAHQAAIAPCCHEPVDSSLSNAQFPGQTR